MPLILMIILIGCLLPFSLFANATEVEARTTGGELSNLETATIDIDLAKVVRIGMEPSFFGFNIEWLPFQIGYFRNGQVRSEIIEWLRPFRGAVYRYPGGEKANWFNWTNAVGPISKRLGQRTNDADKDVAYFGLDEFLRFTQQVEGVPLLVTNLYGEAKSPWSESAIVALNRELVRYTNNTTNGVVHANSSTTCNLLEKCRVKWWELGNELDWKSYKWSAEKIVDRVKKVAQVMKEEDETIRLIVPTQTTGYIDEISDKSISEFNQKVARSTATDAHAFATHIYYEGRSVSSSLEYIVGLHRDLTSAGLVEPKILVTEHARWPNRPLTGKWQTTWRRTGDLRGAIATADFMIGLLGIDGVDMALWHQLGARGPWQLFYRSARYDAVWPNVVYWGLRVLRSGFLDDVVTTRMSSKSDTWPGYSVRAAFMRSSNGNKHSLLAVNRSDKPVAMRINIPQWSLQRRNVNRAYISSSQYDASNDEANRNHVSMIEEDITVIFDKAGTATIVLPSHSVASHLFQQ